MARCVPVLQDRETTWSVSVTRYNHPWVYSYCCRPYFVEYKMKIKLNDNKSDKIKEKKSVGCNECFNMLKFIIIGVSRREGQPTAMLFWRGHWICQYITFVSRWCCCSFQSRHSISPWTFLSTADAGNFWRIRYVFHSRFYPWKCWKHEVDLSLVEPLDWVRKAPDGLQCQASKRAPRTWQKALR